MKIKSCILAFSTALSAFAANAYALETKFFAYARLSESLALRNSARLWLAGKQTGFLGIFPGFRNMHLAESVEIWGTWNRDSVYDSEFLLGKNSEVFTFSHSPTFSLYQIGTYEQSDIGQLDVNLCQITVHLDEDSKENFNKESVPFYPSNSWWVYRLEMTNPRSVAHELSYDEALAEGNPDFLLPIADVANCTAEFLINNSGTDS